MLVKWIKNILWGRRKPRCFGDPHEVFNPGHYAENCCDDCKYVDACSITASYIRAAQKADTNDVEKNTEVVVSKLEIKPCPKCGGEPNLVLGYDFEYVICEKCKCRTETEIGDYYDEGFMDGSYVIPRWNAGVVIN